MREAVEKGARACSVQVQVNPGAGRYGWVTVAVVVDVPEASSSAKSLSQIHRGREERRAGLRLMGNLVEGGARTGTPRGSTVR